MHQGPAGHLPPKGPQLCPRMQTPGGGVWAGTPPCGKTPPGPALHLNGRRDRRPLAGRARAQGAPADLPRLDRCSPAGHLEGLQAEGARPRRICRDTAKESRPAGRTPGPPPRATSTPDRASAAPLPAPEGLQADTAGRLDLSAAVEAGPDAASTPAATRPPAPRPPGELCHTRAQDAAGRPADRHGPGHQQPASPQPGPAGHLNTGSPAPCGFGQMDTQAPARPCPHPRKICRDGRGQRCHLNRGRAAADTGQHASWTPQRPGRSGRNSVGCSQPAPPLDTGSRGPCRTPQRLRLAGHEKSTKPAEMVRNLVRKNANLLKISVFCGGERTRTAVQTPHQAAFYTLIRPLVFVPPLPDGGRRRP